MMSKTYFTIAEQKTNVINFIKKHKDILRIDGSKDITAEFIGELVKSNNAKFFSLVHKVRLKFGQNFYIFSDNCDENRHNMRRTITIWLPVDLSKNASDKAIKEFCDSLSFEDAIEDCHCLWFNMTPKRWETFEAIFDFYDKPKKTAKKAKKIVKPEEVKLSHSARLKDDIVF